MPGSRSTAGAGRVGRRGLVLTAALVAVACAGVSEPVRVSLEELVVEQDHYEGQVVTTDGVVRSHDDPVHYWIEDPEPHRVELFPHDAVEDLVDVRVEVTGEFTFEEDRGRAIEIEELEIVGEVPQAAPRPGPRGR